MLMRETWERCIAGVSVLTRRGEKGDVVRWTVQATKGTQQWPLKCVTDEGRTRTLKLELLDHVDASSSTAFRFFSHGNSNNMGGNMHDTLRTQSTE